MLVALATVSPNISLYYLKVLYSQNYILTPFADFSFEEHSGIVIKVWSTYPWLPPPFIAVTTTNRSFRQYNYQDILIDDAPQQSSYGTPLVNEDDIL